MTETEETAEDIENKVNTKSSCFLKSFDRRLL